MAFVVKDRVQDSTDTTGTGPLALDNDPPLGCRSFGSVLSIGDTAPYSIQHRSFDEWEDGIGTYTDDNEWTRTTIKSSSNAGAAVSFSAGTKDIALVILDEMIANIDGGEF